jgi:membrane-bound serine protease (ClpP class)
MIRRLNRVHLVIFVGLLCVRAGFEFPTTAEEAPAARGGEEPLAPAGQFLTISGTVDDTVLGRISRAGLALQNRALQEQRRGVLVLEIRPGSSPFHQILGVAQFLSGELPSLTTVAYIPETLAGNHVVLALACKEIVMRPEVEIGDISLGTPMDPNEQLFVVNLVQRRRNLKINEAIAQKMLDRASELLWVQLEQGTKPNVVREPRIVSRAGYDDLRKAGTQIVDVKIIKDAGSPGIFSTETAQNFNMIVMHAAETRDKVAALYHLPREAMREDPTTGEAPRAMIIRIDKIVDPVLEQFVLRQIDRATASGINLLIFEIDSPGGYAQESMTVAHTIADLGGKKVRTVAYVPVRAYSGAALIAMGCDEIYLKQKATIGHAGDIELGKGGQWEFANQRNFVPLLQGFKNLAEKKGRAPAIGLAMVDKDLAVYKVTDKNSGHVTYMSDEELHQSNGQFVKGDRVPNTGNGELLTLEADEAQALNLAEKPVKDFDELKARLGVPREAVVPVSARTWVDSLIFTLNTGLATGLLLFLGLVGIYLELHIPSGFFGICSAVCFGLFFWSRFLGGTAGWLEVVLFLLGAGCIAIEVFVLPGHMVFGVSGIVLCVSSLILAMQTVVIPATAADMSSLAGSLATLSSAVVGVLVIAALFSRYLPSIPIFNAMILTPPGGEDVHSGEPKLRPELAGAAAVNPLLAREQALVGKQGVAMTVLRPAGKAQIGDDFVDVISEGEFISAGRRIEVLSVSGNRVVVRELA